MGTAILTTKSGRIVRIPTAVSRPQPGRMLNTLHRTHIALDQGAAWRERALVAFHREEIGYGDDLMILAAVWYGQAAKPLLQVNTLREVESDG